MVPVAAMPTAKNQIFLENKWGHMMHLLNTTCDWLLTFRLVIQIKITLFQFSFILSPHSQGTSKILSLLS